MYLLGSFLIFGNHGKRSKHRLGFQADPSCSECQGGGGVPSLSGGLLPLLIEKTKNERVFHGIRSSFPPSHSHLFFFMNVCFEKDFAMQNFISQSKSLNKVLENPGRTKVTGWSVGVTCLRLGWKCASLRLTVGGSRGPYTLSDLAPGTEPHVADFFSLTKTFRWWDTFYGKALNFWVLWV